MRLWSVIYTDITYPVQSARVAAFNQADVKQFIPQDSPCLIQYMGQIDVKHPQVIQVMERGQTSIT